MARSDVLVSPRLGPSRCRSRRRGQAGRLEGNDGDLSNRGTLVAYPVRLSGIAATPECQDYDNSWTEYGFLNGATIELGC